MQNKLISVSSIFLLIVLAFLATPSEAHALVLILNGQNGFNQTFQNDSNVTISSANNIHSLGWLGLLPISRGGTGTGSFTAGSIPFIWSGVFSQDNANLFWDNTNKRLGIGTSSPTTTLDVVGNAKVTSLNSTSDSTVNSLNIGLGGGSVATNMAIGKDALLNANSSSFSNTAVGFQALREQGSAGDSTAIGAFALASNTTGSDGNTAVGSAAMKENTTGGFNVALGSDSLRLNETGDNNTALGHQSLKNNNGNGNNNIGIGYQSALYQADGSTTLASPENSIYIGSQTRGYDNNDSNSIVLGYNAIGAGANTAVIGNSALGNVYFGSASGLANIHAKKLSLGSSGTPGCLVMGDSDGSGVTYITVNDGVISASTTPPSACQ